MQRNLIRKPLWIDRSAVLLEIASVLSRYPTLAVDTESNSLYVYREQVCLLQISTPENDYLIDTLALSDLSPLAPLFANPKIEKIFHASEYDVICLKRDFGFEFKNIFDTMIAARILGEQAIGLASLLKSRMELDLDKKYQRANWGIRPLPPPMLEYACQDTRYLFELRSILDRELKQKNLRDLAREDFELACAVTAHNSSDQPKNCWKVAGANSISPEEAAILKELCDFREREASSQNVPPFKVMTNEVLVKLCRIHPSSLAELNGIKGLNERMIRKYGASIIKAIQIGESAAPLRRPKKIRPDEAFIKRYDALRDWRKNKGKEILVESDVILPKEYCDRIAAANPRSARDLELLMKEIPYRYKHFHKEILQVLDQQEIK
jgi:ribonuclease D